MKSPFAGFWFALPVYIAAMVFSIRAGIVDGWDWGHYFAIGFYTAIFIAIWISQTSHKRRK